MKIKSAQSLVAEALKEIKTIDTDQAFKMLEDNSCNLIDIRDVHGRKTDLPKKTLFSYYFRA